MLSFNLGPLALPVLPVVLLATLVASGALATWLARRRLPADQAALASQAGDALWWAALSGLAAARAVHLALHAAAYAEQPWAVLDLRDGGWHATSGWGVGALVLVARARTLGPLFKAPLGWAAASSWLVVNTVQGVLAISHPAPLPATLAVVDLASGRTTTLAEAAAGRPVVLNLWATWCGPCRAEMPVLAAAQRAHPEVAFLFVNQGEDASTVQRYLAQAVPGLQQVLLDRGRRAGPLLGSQGLPTTVFYRADGQQTSAHLGALNSVALNVRLQALRRDPAPEVGAAPNTPLRSSVSP